MLSAGWHIDISTTKWERITYEYTDFLYRLIGSGLFFRPYPDTMVSSEKKHEVISPTLFWVFSLIGSYLMFYYGWLRNDFSIIVGQFISFYIYIGNLRLKGVWRRIPVLFRILLAVTPLLAAIGTLQDSSHFVENF